MAITNFIPTIWSETLISELNRKFIGVANCNREFEGEIREKGNTVKICGVGAITVSNYTKNTNMSAPETLSDNVKVLTIDQAKYFNFQIDDIDLAQCTPKLMKAAMAKAATALANEADSYVFSLHTSAGQSVSNSNASASNIIDTLIQARTKLLKQNVADPDDIVLEVAPEIAELILKAKATLSSDNTECLEHGCIGKIAGCKIFVSNNVKTVETETGTTYKCFARTRRAIAFADQLSEIDAYRPELRFADAVKGLHLYGAKVVYPQEFVLMNVTILDEE